MPEFQRVDANDRPIEDPVLAILEVICIICFSAEYSVRLVVAPSRRKFLAKPLNIIDFASILPFYLTLAFETIDEEGSEEESENLENVRKVVHVLRLMHIFRILKLARHSVGLRALGATMRHSYEEVGLLILFLSVGISIFFCAHLLGREGECRLRPQHHPCRLVLGHHHHDHRWLRRYVSCYDGRQGGRHTLYHLWTARGRPTHQHHLQQVLQSITRGTRPWTPTNVRKPRSLRTAPTCTSESCMLRACTRSSVGSPSKTVKAVGGGDTDASSLQDVEAEYDLNTLEKNELK